MTRNLQGELADFLARQRALMDAPDDPATLGERLQQAAALLDEGRALLRALALAAEGVEQP